jgi:hypothetical protein
MRDGVSTTVPNFRVRFCAFYGSMQSMTMVESWPAEERYAKLSPKGIELQLEIPER